MVDLGGCGLASGAAYLAEVAVPVEDLFPGSFPCCTRVEVASHLPAAVLFVFVDGEDDASDRLVDQVEGCCPMFGEDVAYPGSEIGHGLAPGLRVKMSGRL